MMFHFPNFGMPYYNRYSRYGYRLPPYTYQGLKNNSYSVKKFENQNDNFHNNIKNKKTPNYQSYNKNSNCDTKTMNNKTTSSADEDAPMFQLFGINLYYDDILLICLIFFLYQEGVKDESLFIALILLLLS